MVFWLLRKGTFRALWPIWVPLPAYRYWRRLPPKRKSPVIDHTRRLTRFALARRNFR